MISSGPALEPLARTRKQGHCPASVDAQLATSAIVIADSMDELTRLRNELHWTKQEIVRFEVSTQRNMADDDKVGRMLKPKVEG